MAAKGLILVVDRRASVLRLESGTLRMEFANGGWRRYPLSLLTSVVVHGAPLVACDLWRALAERGVAMTLLPGRGHGAPAWCGAGLSAYGHWRRRQHLAAHQPDQRLALARWLVQRKLNAAAEMATNFADASIPGAWADHAARLRLAQTDCDAAHHLNSLMGVEGAAAAAGWQVYATAINALPDAERWGFSNRRRRPPPDAVNALLSLTFSLLVGEMGASVIAAGLDPALGFLHQPAPARPALTLDLVEPLRPAAEAWVYGLLRENLKPEDFTNTQSDGVRLGKAARARFYDAWAQRCDDWPDWGGGTPATTDDLEQSESPSLALVCARWVRRLRLRLPGPPDPSASDLEAGP